MDFKREMVELQHAPQSNAAGLVFPWNTYTKTYDISSCDPMLSEGVIQYEDCMHMLQEVERVEHYKNPNCCLWWLIVVPFLLIGMMGLFVGLFVGLAGTSPGAALGGAMGSFFGGFICIVIVLFCVIFRVKQTKRKRLADIQQVLARCSHTTFKDRGIKLSLSPLGMYIKMEFLWKTTVGYPMPPPRPLAYAAPPMQSLQATQALQALPPAQLPFAKPDAVYQSAVGYPSYPQQPAQQVRPIQAVRPAQAVQQVQPVQHDLPVLIAYTQVPELPPDFS